MPTLPANFYVDKSDSLISVNKKLKFTLKNGAVLNGKGIIRIMNLPLASTGTTLFNLKFINGNTKLAYGSDAFPEPVVPLRALPFSDILVLL